MPELAPDRRARDGRERAAVDPSGAVVGADGVQARHEQRACGARPGGSERADGAEQAPPSTNNNTQIETRSERIVERETSGRIFGVDPMVAMVIGAVPSSSSSWWSLVAISKRTKTSTIIASSGVRRG